MTKNARNFPFFKKKKKNLSNNKRHRWDGEAADSGFVGMSVRRSERKRHQTDKRPPRPTCSEDEAVLLYRPTAGTKGCSFPHEGGPALDSMLPSLGNQPARMTSTGKVPSTSAFAPPPPPQNCSRFDFNAFLCSFVFSCKNLTVLECLYFIKCV